MNFTFTELKRFWSRVKKTKGGCWEWTAYKSRGYGQIRLQGKTWRVHILSYRLFNTDYKEGLCIRHKCDNPSCVNPRHLELGTTQQNTQDRVKRGRCAMGSRNGKAKLTAEDVIEIRRRYANGLTNYTQLGKLYNVGDNCIRKIIKGITWTHI